MVIGYTPPKQQRAIETENRFLDAMDELLVTTSYAQLTIERIAVKAGLNKGSFLNRFGNKKQALFVLFKRYCDECQQRIAQKSSNISSADLPLDEICAEVSEQFEQLLIKHFSANRAMYECFTQELEVDDMTKNIFRSAVALMMVIQDRYAIAVVDREESAFYATQLLVTLNFNCVMKAMPAMPVDKSKRHKLVGKLLAQALMFG